MKFITTINIELDVCPDTKKMIEDNNIKYAMCNHITSDIINVIKEHVLPADMKITGETFVRSANLV